MTDASTWVVIPNFNGRGHLARCLPSVLATRYPSGLFHVVIVDDGSTDGSVEWLGQEFPGVNVVRNTGNRGFAGASNTGIRLALASGAYAIAVCNNDTQLTPDWLALAVPTLQQQSHVGLLGFIEVTPDREHEFFGFQSQGADGLDVQAVKAIPGCLMLFTSACLRHVGLFDEDFFMYGEDNDMFLRLHHAGWAVAQVPIPVWHFAGGSSTNRRLGTSWLAYRNAMRYAIKNESLLGIARVFASLAHQGINPLARGRTPTPSFDRLRRSGVMMNVVLFTAAVAWNLAHIGKTIRARRGRTPTPKLG
jgi:GT2 family glycosyltransferase